MAITTHLMTPQLTEDAVSTNSWGYPAASDVIVKKGVNFEVHEIYYSGTPSTLFDNAPLGSTLQSVATGKLYLKTAAAGTGTWETVTSS